MNTKIQVTDNKFYMIKLLTIFHQRCDAGDKSRGTEAKNSYRYWVRGDNNTTKNNTDTINTKITYITLKRTVN